MRRFVELCCAQVNLAVRWQGQGLEECGVTADGRVIVRVDPRYFRPAEVETLLGDPTKAHAQLGWKPTTTLEQLVEEMMNTDCDLAKREQVQRQAGFSVNPSRE